MASMSNSPQGGPRVADDPSASRFEFAADGEVAELVYRHRADRLVLTHSEVPEALGGRSIGGLLVEAAVGRAEREGLTIVPLCPFARSWLQRHPDAAARVTIDWGDQPGE